MDYVPQPFPCDATPMPGRFSPSAPRFDSSRPYELHRYLDEVALLLSSAYIGADSARKQWTMYYLDDNAYELWSGLPEVEESYSFERFRDAIIEMYPEAEPTRRYSYFDITCLIQKWRQHGITSDVELGQYRREFLVITTFLMRYGRLADCEQRRLFVSGLPEALLDLVAQRIQRLHPDDDPDDTYSVDEVYQAGLFVLRAQRSRFFTQPMSNHSPTFVPAPLPIASHPQVFLQSQIASGVPVKQDRPRSIARQPDASHLVPVAHKTSPVVRTQLRCPSPAAIIPSKVPPVLPPSVTQSSARIVRQPNEASSKHVASESSHTPSIEPRLHSSFIAQGPTSVVPPPGLTPRSETLSQKSIDPQPAPIATQTSPSPPPEPRPAYRPCPVHSRIDLPKPLAPIPQSLPQPTSQCPQNSLALSQTSVSHSTVVNRTRLSNPAFDQEKIVAVFSSQSPEASPSSPEPHTPSPQVPLCPREEATPKQPQNSPISSSQPSLAIPRPLLHSPEPQIAKKNANFIIQPAQPFNCVQTASPSVSLIPDCVLEPHRVLQSFRSSLLPSIEPIQLRLPSLLPPVLRANPLSVWSREGIGFMRFWTAASTPGLWPFIFAMLASIVFAFGGSYVSDGVYQFRSDKKVPRMRLHRPFDSPIQAELQKHSFQVKVIAFGPYLATRALEMKIKTLDHCLHPIATFLDPSPCIRSPLPYSISSRVQRFSQSDHGFTFSSLIKPFDHVHHLQPAAPKGVRDNPTLVPGHIERLRLCASLVLGIYLAISHILVLYGFQYPPQCCQSFQDIIAFVIPSPASLSPLLSSLSDQAFDLDHLLKWIEDCRSCVSALCAALCRNIKLLIQPLSWRHLGMPVAMVATMKFI